MQMKSLLPPLHGKAAADQGIEHSIEATNIYPARKSAKT
jgi:hypothetical protein